MSFDDLDLAIHQRISDNLKLRDKFRYIKLNKYLKDNLQINIRKIPDKYIPYLNDTILRAFPDLSELSLFYEDWVQSEVGCNTKITDLSYMKNMKKLDIGCSCGGPCCFGENYDIKFPPNLKILHVVYNPSVKINNRKLPSGLEELLVAKENFVDMEGSSSASEMFQEIWNLAPTLKTFGFTSGFMDQRLVHILPKYVPLFETLLELNPNIKFEY